MITLADCVAGAYGGTVEAHTSFYLLSSPMTENMAPWVSAANGSYPK